MGTGPHRSVRVRSTLLAALATAIAMALLTNAVALGVRRTLAAHARDHLGELLDAAERSVWRGRERLWYMSTWDSWISRLGCL